MGIPAAYYTGNKTFVIKEVETSEPGPGEVQIQVAYCGICGTDMHVFHGHMDARVGTDRVIGHEMSGVVASVGEAVQGLSEGDKVVVRPLAHCGRCPACDAGHRHICHNLKFLGLDTDGALQERWNVPAYTVHKLPAELSLQHAALVEPLAVACHDVRLGRVLYGETVLVIGGGPIGTLIAMVARHAGARVILAEINQSRLALAHKLGFETIDPAAADVGETIHAMTADKGANVVFEVSGSQAGVEAMTTAAASRGRIVMVAIHPKKPQVDLFRFFWREIEMLGARVYEEQDYERAIAMLADRSISAEQLITDVKALEDIQEAFNALDDNPTAMKTLLRVSKKVPA
jgi:2-desacetyl-2-hydroxyethyl bacteriochlorophyllide A dehydrogenase